MRGLVGTDNGVVRQVQGNQIVAALRFSHG